MTAGTDEVIVDNLARKILDYMRLDMPIHSADLLIGLGGLDIRIAQHTARLFLDGFAPLIVFTGGLGKVTKDTQSESEAERFRDAAIAMGVPSDKILIETKATNTGENIRFTQKLLDQHDLEPHSLIAVTKPYMERRAWAAFKKQWISPDADVQVTSPDFGYEGHFSGSIPKDMFISLMVGDLQRIKELPKQGFQIEQEIPDDVWAAYQALVERGYTKYLINW